jgi:putative endonuclease
MYYVYIIYSPRLNIYYKGISQNPEKRITEHNNGLSIFTANRGPWELIYLEKISTKSEALIREKAIKKLNRKSILRLIENSKNILT